jgi:hypothetical protein
MSYFIANSISYNKEENRIYVKGGSNNVVPRCNSWTHYEENKYLLKDLISGGLDLRSNCTFAQKCKDAVEIIKKRWHNQFGKRNEEFGGSLSINPYSLFMISNYSQWHKEETIKNSYNLEGISEHWKEEKLREAKATETVFDEAVKFYQEQENYFLEKIIDTKIQLQLIY